MRNTRNIKVKVQVDQLLAAVKKRREDRVKAHDKAKGEHSTKEVAYAAKVAAALRKAADVAEKGKLPEADYRKAVRVPVGVTAPDKPSLDTGNIDRLIKTLEMAADDTITISAEDAAQYLG